MRTAFYLWLVEAENSLLLMNRGVFRFVIEWLPRWIYRFVVETVGPVAIRLCRVSGLGFLWLMILFGPYILACVCGLPGWLMFASLAWVVIAITGSIWGLNRVVKNRNAVASEPMVRERQ
jgi:hypothetical protein